MSREALGHFELLILLAILRLEDNAYGATIVETLEQATSRPIVVTSVYAALDRLQQKGLTRSRLGEATAERGGRAKRFFTLTTKGLRQVKAARTALDRLWTGVPRLAGGRA